MNKQSQTCYVVNNGRTDLTLKGIRKFEYVNELTDRYIFTKEELEAHDSKLKETLITECKRIKIQRNEYEIQLRTAHREIIKLRTELKLVQEYANQKKNEWQKEADDWFYPEKGEYPEMVENKNYSLNVLAEVEGMNDIQVMCYCYIPGEDGGFIWANCDKKLDGDAEFDDNYIVKKWKPIPVI